MQKRKIKFVITDIDGVVFDRMPVWQATFAEMMLRHYGVPADIAGRHYYDTAGIHLSGQLEMILKTRGINFTAEEINAFVEEFIQLSRKTEPKLFPGVKEVLEQIKRAGKDLLASSGSPTPELAMLFAKYNLPYDFFIGSDEVKKGDRHIELLAKHFSLPPAEFCGQALYIGDGPPDMELGKRNGIFAVGITNTVSAEKLLAAGADTIIANITELLNHLN